MLSFWRKRKKQSELANQLEQTMMSEPTLNARRRLENSDYILPKDRGEESRLNFQHYALYHAIGSHYVAPISPQNLHLMLDVGTGTGIWAVEMARLFPQAQVMGIDVDTSLFIQKDMPENCFLRQGDILTRLPFPDAVFSYTHQRLLVAGITAEKWPGAIRELLRVTRLGGWVELIELDNQMQNAGPAGQHLQNLMAAIGKSMGFDGEVIRHLGDLLQSEGVQSVEIQPISLPVGEWGGRPGQMMKQDLLTALEAVKPVYCEKGKISIAEFDRIVQVMTLEWESYHATCTFFAVCGKRVRP